jgi:DNA-binding transcriptional regulator of glucitol operon
LLPATPAIDLPGCCGAGAATLTDVRGLWTPSWLVRHALVLILVVAFLGMAWWQISRAIGGNLLSYAYAVEWPVFAGFVVYVWLREVRRELGGETSPAGEPSAATGPGAAPRRPARIRSQAAYDDSDDPALAAYNDYLAWLNANPHATAADYPGRSG